MGINYLYKPLTLPIMTDLIISYEDGLRLSELYGQLQGCEYQLDHLLSTFSLELLVIAALGCLIGFFIGIYLTDYVHIHDGLVVTISTIATSLLLLGIAIVVVDIAGPIAINQDVAVIEGQMEILLTKYGMTWEDILNSGLPM